MVKFSCTLPLYKYLFTYFFLNAHVPAEIHGVCRRDFFRSKVLFCLFVDSLTLSVT